MSDTITYTGLTSVLANMTSEFSKVDSGWIQFVDDYVDYIKSNSDILTIDETFKTTYSRRLTSFLIAHNIDQSYSWIICKINNIDMFEDFTSLKTLLVPNSKIIDDLYYLYQTSSVVNS